jgi:CRISPR-associated protein Csd1
MILQALIAYAERENLGDADFETVAVRWLIPLGTDGKLAGNPIPLSEDPSARKPRPKPMLRPFTSPNELNQGTRSHFLCDTLERTILLPDPKATESKIAARRVQHAYFKSLLSEAAAACANDPEAAPSTAALRAIKTFLDDENALASLRAQFSNLKAKPTENVTFKVGDSIILEFPAPKKFWRSRRQAAVASGANKRAERICIATGELGEVLDTTEKIKGVPGGLATGTNLISFDKDAFCSYDLNQAQNAALSPHAELKIRSALNERIEKSRAQGLVFNGTVYIHWTRDALNQADPIDLLHTPDANAIAQLLQSQKTGRQYSDLDANAYYCAGLTGNGARIVVRDWIETTVPEVEQSIAAWFRDLTLVNPDGMETRNDFKFGALLYGLVRDKLDELAPQISAQLLHAALRNTPLPQTALAAALRRQQLDENKLVPARLALIKAFLLRSPNKKEHHTMTEKLDAQSKDIAYRCGQLFAVIGRLQLLALGKVGASIAERTYGGVATRPATTVGPLFNKLPAYLKKANARFPGSGTNKQKEIETLSCAIDTLGGFPKSLELEEQGRFALGYYCQLAQYRADREESLAADQAGKIETPDE